MIGPAQPFTRLKQPQGKKGHTSWELQDGCWVPLDTLLISLLLLFSFPQSLQFALPTSKPTSLSCYPLSQLLCNMSNPQTFEDGFFAGLDFAFAYLSPDTFTQSFHSNTLASGSNMNPDNHVTSHNSAGDW